jgi:hypothetical protein
MAGRVSPPPFPHHSLIPNPSSPPKASPSPREGFPRRYAWKGTSSDGEAARDAEHPHLVVTGTPSVPRSAVRLSPSRPGVSVVSAGRLRPATGGSGRQAFYRVMGMTRGQPRPDPRRRQRKVLPFQDPPCRAPGRSRMRRVIRRLSTLRLRGTLKPPARRGITFHFPASRARPLAREGNPLQQSCGVWWLTRGGPRRGGDQK